MNYLEWKKKILVYMVARGKPVDAIPEELEFYLYSKFKAIDAKSLPGSMSIALPIGLSAKKAVACIAEAFRTVFGITYEDNMTAAAPIALAATDLETITEAELQGKAVDCLSMAAEFTQTRITAELQAVGRDTDVNVVTTFAIKDISLGVVATVCSMTTEYAALHIAAIAAASALITEVPTFTMSASLSLPGELAIGVTPDAAFIEEMVGDLDLGANLGVELDIDSVEAKGPEGVEVGLPGSQIAVAAELIGMAPADAKVDADVSLGVKVTCVKRAVITDFTGVTIASLTGQTVESLQYIEI